MEHYRSDEGSVFFGSGTPTAFADRPSLFLDRVNKILYVNKGNSAVWTAQVADATLLAQISLDLGLGALAFLDTVSIARGGTGMASQLVKFKAHNNDIAIVCSPAGSGHTALLMTTDSGLYGYDSHGCFAGGLFTPSVAGIYRFAINLDLETPAAGKRIVVSVHRNSLVTEGVRIFDQVIGGTGDVLMSGSLDLYANGTTDFFGLDVFHNNVADINMRGQSYLSSWSACLLL